MAFEWDETKRLSNLAKHDIDFLDAEVVFDGRPNIILRGSTLEEERFLTVALLDGRFITVIWT